MKKRARSRKREGSLGSLLPRSKRERRRVELLGGVAVALFSVLILAVFAFSSLQQVLLRSPNVAAVISAVLVDLANTDRSSNELSTLTVNPVLVAAAQAKANDMATYGYFAHVSPQGVDPWHWFQQAGYKFTYAGENLAVDFSDSGDVNTAWMNSPTHRENILDPHYTEIGIATAQGMYEGHPTTFVVQEFGTPSVGKTSPKVTATIPTVPAEIATAQPENGAVLGEQISKIPTSTKKVVTPAPQSNVIATTEPALAASLSKDTSANIPLWGFLIGFPRDTLRYLYYCIAGLILLALIVDTELEFRSEHRKRALRAGTLLVVMAVLFFVANALFFAEPTLAAGVASAI